MHGDYTHFSLRNNNRVVQRRVYTVITRYGLPRGVDDGLFSCQQTL